MFLGGGLLTFFVVSRIMVRMMRPSHGKKQPQMTESVLPAETPQPEREKRIFPFWSSVKSIFYKLLRISRLAPAGPLYASFKEATTLLKKRSLLRNPKYALPWTIVVGGRVSGKSNMLSGLQLPQPIKSPAASAPGSLDWWFLEEGVVLNVDSRCFLSQSTDETGWFTFLRNLQHWRPRNPVDSVVLTISLEEIMQAAEDVQQALAEKIAKPLLMLESVLGVSLPLHIVVTKTDFLPGFQGLAHVAKQAGKSGEILGWTNPYDADKRFDGSEIKEAVESVQSDLHNWTLHCFSEGVSAQYRDDIMVFIERLGGVIAPLQRNLKTLLGMGGYKDNFYVRGLSFVGQEVEQSQVFFGDDLISKKVFQERGVARPLQKIFGGHNRLFVWIRSAIVLLSLVWGVGLFLDHKRLQNTVFALRPLMQKTVTNISGREMAEVGEEELQKQTFKNATKNTLKLLSQSAKYDLFSWFMPASWMSGLEGDLDDQVFKLYDVFVAQPMYRCFQGRAEKLIIETDARKEQWTESLSMTDVTSFCRLKDYLIGVEDLEDHVNLYNSLPKTQDVKSFQMIIQYLYDFNLGESFFTQKTLLQEKILKNIQYSPFYLSDYVERARERFFDVFNAFLVSSFHVDRLFSAPRALQNALEKIDRSGIAGVEEVYGLLEKIDATTNMLMQDGGAWLAREHFVPSSDLEQVLETIQKTGFLGVKVVDHCTNSLTKIFHKTTTFLESFGSMMTGHFFVRSQELGVLVPSMGLSALRKAIVLSLKKGFMQRASHEKMTTIIPKGQILHWDKQMLIKALAIIKEYRVFMEQELQTFPEAIQETMRLMSRKQLEANVEGVLARAQTFFQIPVTRWSNHAEEVSRAYADNLQEVAPLFADIITHLNELGAHTLFVTVRDALFKQMYTHLKELEELVQKGAFFYPDVANIRWWKGEKGVVYQLYGADDRLDMRSLWGNHVKRFKEMMALHVSPVLDLLTSPLMHMETKEAKIVDRWAHISEQLASYEEGKDSTIKILEAFVMEEGNMITFENYKEHIHESIIAKRHSDFFLNIAVSIKRSIYERCRELTAEVAMRDYTVLARYFNNHMAGVYPFVKENMPGMRLESEVDPDSMKDFFEKFSKLSTDKLKSLRDHPAYKGSFKDVKKFLADMWRLKEFLDTFFAPSKEGEDPGISFLTEYRANKARDVFGEHIIDWAVISGEEEIGLQGGKTEGYWRMGQPFTVGVQFVVQSPLAPVASRDMPNLVVLGDRALFVYEGFWSWLRLLQNMQATAADGNVGGDTLLKLEIPMAEKTTGQLADKTKVFLRIIPRQTNGKAKRAFRIPPFPVRAPYFTKGDE
ncbi:MAG: hypothetical protein OXC30_01220 [Alphaproteobacteria bacterium]|nr:hypothetical protein [Alphaproteobacteria bacterium]